MMMMMMMKRKFVYRIVISISNALSILMLRKKKCLQRLFESAFSPALISELFRKRIPDGRTGDRN